MSLDRPYPTGRPPRDLPRAELMLHAEGTRRTFLGLGVQADVYFKYTCEACGERVLFAEPNVLYEHGTCDACGHEQEVTRGGYLVHEQGDADALLAALIEVLLGGH